MNGALSTGKQQTLSFWILAHHVSVLIGGNAVGYLIPAGTTIMRSVDMRPQIVQTQRVDGGIGCILIEMPGIQDRNFLPGLELFGSHIGPVGATVSSAMNQAIVGSHPNQIHVKRRRRHGIDHATLRWLRGRLRAKLADSL